MTARGRLLLTVVGTVAALLTALGLATPAGAAPYTSQTTISVGTQNPAPGSTLSVNGSGFTPGERIALGLVPGGHYLASVTADQSGSFSTEVSLPSGLTGDYALLAVGEESGHTTGVDITIGSSHQASGGGSSTGTSNGSSNTTASGSGSNSTSGGSGNLAYTGAAIGGVAGVGIALLVGGALMLTAGRRRKASA